MQPTRTVVWHEPTDRHAIVDHPSQISDFVNELLGRPSDASIEVIPKEFYIFDNVPHHSIGEAA